MTNPIGGGAPNLSYDDNSVTASLKLDIPADSTDILKEVSRYTGEIQANLEAAARFGADYMDYLKSFPEIQRQVNDIQRETLQLIRDSASAMDQLRASSGGYGMAAGAAAPFGPTTQYYGQMGLGYGAADRYNDVRSVPQQVQQQQMTATSEAQQQSRDSATYNYIQSFGGIPGSNIYPVGPGLSYATFTMGGATGIPAEPLFRDLDGGAGKRREVETKRQQAVRERQAANSLHFVEDDEQGNAQSHGRPRRGVRFGRHAHPDDIAASEDRSAADSIKAGEHNINTINSVFQNLMGAVGSEDTPVAGRMSLIGSMMKSAGTIPGLGLLAKGGLLAGGAALGFNMVQNVGEKISGYRNQDIYNHSLSGGMGIEKDVMMMSLNPLLTTEQSREIIMGALRVGGQRGTESYNSAVDFIKKNLIDMNMDVSKSVDLLRSNVDLGKQSVESLGLSLKELQGSGATQKGGMPATQQAFETYNDLLLGVGVGGKEAAANSVALANAFAGSDALSKDNGSGQMNGTATLASLLQSPDFLALTTARVAPGTRSDMLLAKLSKQSPSAVPEAALGTLYGIAVMYSNNLSEGEAKKQFWYRMRGFGVEVRQDVSDAFYDWLLSKGITGIIEDMAAGVQQGTTPKLGTDNITSTKLTYKQWEQQDGNKGKSLSEYYKSQFGGHTSISASDADLTRQQIAEVAKQKGVSPSQMGLLDPSTNIVYQINPYNDQEMIGLQNGSLKLVVTDSKNMGVMGSTTPDAMNNPTDFGISSNTLDASHIVGAPMDFVTSVGSPTEYGSVSPGTDKGTPQGTNNGITYGATTSNSPTSGTTKVEVTVGLTPDAQRWLQQYGGDPGSVPNDPNGINSNYGYNGAQRNAAAPGNRPR